MEIARDPVPLLQGPLAHTEPRLGQLHGGSLTLADNGAEEERRQRRNGDVGLRAQGPVVDRLLEERPEIVGGHADGYPGRDHDCERGAWSPETQSRPDQRRKDHVGHRFVGREGKHAEGGNGDQQEAALPGRQTPPCRAGDLEPRRA